jgi:molybdate transport system ATP-binding protein
VMLLDGRVVAVGPPTEVLGRSELMEFHAVGEAGALIEAKVSGHDQNFGLTNLESSVGTFQAPHLDLPVGTLVRMRIRARDVMIATKRPEGLSALNVLTPVAENFPVPAPEFPVQPKLFPVPLSREFGSKSSKSLD